MLLTNIVLGIFILHYMDSTCFAVGDTALPDACPLSTSPQYPVYDIRNCPGMQQYGTNSPVRRLEVLPGLGFDNLRYLEMGQVHLYNYSTCKMTEDGRYMIPDSVFVVPLQEGHYKFYADYFDHWDNYSSITNSKVDIKYGVSIFSLKIGGTYSKEKQSVKENQVNYNSKTTRVNFRNRVYAVHLDSSAELHPKFKSKVYEIAASVQINDTATAKYLSELLVRSYGTHYITSVEAGAVFVKLDSISETYSSHADRLRITSAATISFPIFQMFDGSPFTFNYSNSVNETEAYQSNITRTEIYTIGGALFTPDLNLSQWVKEASNRLAVIDRRADPIHFAVTPTQFPELPVLTVRAISDYVLEATKRYYEYNTVVGCVDPTAQNFNFQANFGDSSYCVTSVSQIDQAFGGLYQTCRQTGRENLCSDRMIEQVNPQTGDYSCPAGYTAVELYSGMDMYIGAYTTYYRTCGWFSCDTRSRSVTETTQANYETYWCVVIDTPEQYRGYLFGGFFTQTSSNPITGTQSCPPYYRVQKIAMDVSICVTNDYELGGAHAIGFAGFHSCRVGNPLSVPSNTTPFPSVSDWPHNCPQGYSQHLVAVENGCEINVCLENGAFESKTLNSPVLPPFQTRPPILSGLVEQLVVFAVDGSILVRNTAGQWETFPRESVQALLYLKLIQNDTTLNPPSTLSPNSSSPFVSPSQANNLSSYTLASLIMSSVAVASLIILVLVLISHAVYTGRRKNHENQECFTLHNQ